MITTIATTTGGSDFIPNIDWDLILRYLLPVLGVLALLFFGWIIAAWADRLVRKALYKAKIEETLAKFGGKLAKWSILAFALLGCLGLFGINVTSIAAVAAAAGFAVGLALQGTLANFAAGVMLLVFRPFKVGDVVTVAGCTGCIDEIDLFQTAMDTPDNRRLLVPNSSIFGAVIENVTYHERRRVDVTVGTEYAADLDRTRDVLRRAASQVKLVLPEPAPDVALLDLGASSVNWAVRVWAKSTDYGAVKDALTRAIKMALDEAGIGIPFPQMDVRVQQVPG